MTFSPLGFSTVETALAWQRPGSTERVEQWQERDWSRCHEDIFGEELLKDDQLTQRISWPIPFCIHVFDK